ncbi:hypothetical protein [Rubritalea sp.]|uniref:hypothetical protein n=1 Tax=Rubritalea sp. TaxID=2109375 RepID=UPI00324235B5
MKIDTLRYGLSSVVGLRLSSQRFSQSNFFHEGTSISKYVSNKSQLEGEKVALVELS